MKYIICLILLAGCNDVCIVNRVIDGDTIVCDHEVVRLAGINAEEFGTFKGERATKKLKQLVEGKEVLIKPRGTCYYGRRLGVVFLDDLNVNKEMYQLGYVDRYYYKGEAKPLD